MTEIIRVTSEHWPYCNVRCTQDSHWMVGKDDKDIDLHAHSDEQASGCAACAEKAAT